MVYVATFSSPPSFALRNPLTGERIECKASREVFEQAVALGARRVEVRAIGHYDAQDKLTRLDVEHIEAVPDDADLPTFDDLPRLTRSVGDGLDDDQHADVLDLWGAV